MVSAPFSFVCSSCGADHSAMLNDLVRQQYPEAPSPVAPAACLKHGWPISNHCLVCQKPICPKCMEVFGYVCSSLCAESARKAGLEVPVYEGHFAVVRARARRQQRLTILAASVACIAILGAWAWYQFVATKPSVAWSVRFAEPVDAADARLLPPHDAMVRRGDRLIRYDLAAKKERWSIPMGPVPGSAEDGVPPSWHETGGDLWVARGDKVVRYDGRTGEVAQEVPVGGVIQRFFPEPAAIAVVAQAGDGHQVSTRIDLSDGSVRQEELALAGMKPSVQRPVVARAPLPAAADLGSGPAPIRAARAIQLLANRPLPPEDDEAAPGGFDGPIDPSREEILGGGGGLVQFSVKRLEQKMAAVQAMKDAPAKPALSGDISAASSLAVINETLNDWQRERTGGVEQEDVSRYQVTLKRLLQPRAAPWTGEVVGPPGLFPLPTVSVLIAGRNLTVFDQANRKAWEGRLAYPVSSHLNEGRISILGQEAALTSPCVERDGRLFVVDRGMVTAFDLASGNVRWRLPGVGTSGLLFDERGMIYLNTTDAAQEKVKYSQQIDIENKTRALILKVDPQSGKILWRARNVGWLARATGKFLYAVEWAAGEDGARPDPNRMAAHVRIHRLDPGDGEVKWEYYQAREPLAFDFERNTIQVVFKKEMQIIKFFSF